MCGVLNYITYIDNGGFSAKRLSLARNTGDVSTKNHTWLLKMRPAWDARDKDRHRDKPQPSVMLIGDVEL